MSAAAFTTSSLCRLMSAKDRLSPSTTRRSVAPCAVAPHRRPNRTPAYPALRAICGFTLIELMITVAIIAILASIAMPAYTDYIIRGKLTDAQNGLQSYRVHMEQYFQDNRTYGSDDTCGAAPPTSSYFAYTCTTDGDTYTATATGTDASVSGFTFTINQINQRNTTAAPTGWGPLPPATSPCWIIRKGGGCV